MARIAGILAGRQTMTRGIEDEFARPIVLRRCVLPGIGERGKRRATWQCGSKTTREGDDAFERDEAAGHPFAPIALSRFQSVLHRACASSLAKRVSEVGELQSVWRTDAPDAGTVEFAH